MTRKDFFRSIVGAFTLSKTAPELPARRWTESPEDPRYTFKVIGAISPDMCPTFTLPKGKAVSPYITV